MPVGTQRAASALFVVLGRFVYGSRTLHAASLPTLSSFNVIIRLRLTPNDCPPETGATRSEATEGGGQNTAHRSSLNVPRSSAHRSSAHRSSAHRSSAHRSSAHRSYILYNKVYSPHSLLLLSFLHPFLQFS